jgi:hypothetical protein
MRRRKIVVALLLCLGLALLALRSAGARRGPSLDDRIAEARLRRDRIEQREDDLIQAGAPREDIEEARREHEEAEDELLSLKLEYHLRRRSWLDRLKYELRQRTGW